MAPPFDHNLAAVSVIPAPVLVPVMPAPVVVPIPVSLAYLYPSAGEPDISALRADHRFVDNDQGTGKCRHGEEWNNTEGKNSFHHGTLPLVGTLIVPIHAGCADGAAESV
jgi:hypothetical protein